ncbi:MAG: hypothetical protein IT245_06665 [Bacteroidia bacterium]|nr:hypothetical protein [Bacteroidia bacterium]
MAMLFCPFLSAQNGSVHFSFNLDTISTTSAGIYSNSGKLIRTLWNLKTLEAGTHDCEWDRLDDLGRLLLDTGYYLRVLSNNVQYTWEGVIGNNSDSLTGSSKLRHFDRIHSMVVKGNWLYYAAGYAEGMPSCYKLNVNQPNRKYNILYDERENVDQNSDFVASDSQYVYWAGYDPFDSRISFVYATDINSDTEVVFSNGQELKMHYGRTYLSSIAIDTFSSGRISGMAVQPNGDFLFIARSEINQLQIYSKSSGQLKRSHSFRSPMSLVSGKDGKLWMAYATDSILALYFDTSGSIDSVAINKRLPSRPLAMALSNQDSFVSIIFGDTFQQVYTYLSSMDTLVKILGQTGGYIQDNFVYDDKFYFDDLVGSLNRPYLCYDEIGGLWIGDVGNNRTLRFSANGVLLDKIEYLPSFYSVAVDKNDSTRLFAEFLEYKIDYQQTLGPKNNSWRLHRNWRYAVDSIHNNPGGISVLRNVVTLSNGRTYAFVDFLDSYYVRYPELIELPDTGNFKYSGWRLDKFANDQLFKDGSRLWYNSGFVNNGHASVMHAEISGYDSLGFPEWGLEDTLVLVPFDSSSPSVQGVPLLARTGSNKMILFNIGKLNEGFHLGSINLGDSNFSWQSAKATQLKYRGAYPESGAFDIGNGVEYPGATVNAVDHSIFWNYHGEFWKNSQVNRWQHVYDNGLSIGNFGITTPDGLGTGVEAFKGGAGNALSSAIVKVGDVYYIYHCDESVHSGIHRWKISGLNTIKEQAIRTSIPQLITGQIQKAYFNDKFLDPVEFKFFKLDSLLSSYSPVIAGLDSTSMSMRLNSYLRINKTDKYQFAFRTRNGMRFWCNGVILVDTFGTTSNMEILSDSIMLDSGFYYPIRIEFNDYMYSVKWSSNSFSQNTISSNLLASKDTMRTSTVDLMSGLELNNGLKDQVYGWQRWPKLNREVGLFDHWRVDTYIKSYDLAYPDIFVNYAGDTLNSYVERNLPNAGTCKVSWDIVGEINFDEDFNVLIKNNASRLEVLDDSGVCIAYLSHEMIKEGNNYVSKVYGSDSVFMTRTGQYTNSYTNRFKALQIHVDSNGIDYLYGDYQLLNMPLGSSKWKIPTKLRLLFQPGTGTYGAAFGVRKLVYSSKDSLQPSIYPKSLTGLCTGDTIELYTDSFMHYTWQNGDTSRYLSISNAGNYKVKVSDLYCQGTSALKVLASKPKPIPSITQNGLVLYSNYSYGNSWYLNDVLISNANDTFYNLVYPGTYSLMVTDTNGCWSKVDLLVPLAVNESIIQYGCLTDNKIWISGPNSIEGELQVSDDGGLTWHLVYPSKILQDSTTRINWIYQLTHIIGQNYKYSYKDERGKSIVVALDFSTCQFKSGFIVKPNPFSREWTLVFGSELPINRLIEYQLCDINGKICNKGEISTIDKENGYLTVSGEGLSEGLYILRVIENGEELERLLLFHIQ